MIKYLKFTLGNILEGYKTVEIFIGTKKVSYKILRNGLLEINKKNSYTVEASEEWLTEFDALNIFSWSKEISNVEISGDIHWKLSFKHGKKNYNVQSLGAYPENWERFLDWLDKLIPDMQFINHKRLEMVTLNYSRDDKIFETLTLDRHEKILKLTKRTAQIAAEHIYHMSSVEDVLFTAAQNFLEGLEIQPFVEEEMSKIKIELIRHDGSRENINAIYNEGCLPGLTKFIEVIHDIVNDLSAEILLPSDDVIKKQQGKYIFCKVQFKGSYKSYTYRTEDETLAVGDIVDVPVGKNNDIAQAKLVEIGYFDEAEAPFPVDKIKIIAGKHIANEWENY